MLLLRILELLRSGLIEVNQREEREMDKNISIWMIWTRILLVSMRSFLTIGRRLLSTVTVPLAQANHSHGTKGKTGSGPGEKGGRDGGILFLRLPLYQSVSQSVF